MPYFHAEPSTDATAKEGKEEQGGFGYAPIATLGLVLVNAIDEERENVEAQEDAIQTELRVHGKGSCQQRGMLFIVNPV